MATLIIEHLEARDLPEDWARQLAVDGGQKVTVRIETEAPPHGAAESRYDPAFGMWGDHPSMREVKAFVDELRKPRVPDVPSDSEPHG